MALSDWKKTSQNYKLEIYTMSDGWYYTIREKKHPFLLVFSSQIRRSKEEIKKFGKRRLALYNAQAHISEIENRGVL